MIASLPMYDWPELQPASDALWAGLRDRLVAKGFQAPQELTRTVDCDSNWLSPDLVFGNTCGYSLVSELFDKVTYLATPVREIEGCEGTNYSSAFVMRRDCDFHPDNSRDLKFAYNSKKSWSGYHTVTVEFGDPGQYYGSTVESGGHRQSARLVANRSADVAAIDAICWHYLQRHEPQTAGKLKVVGWSALFPSPPFITSIETPAQMREVIQASLGEVLSDEGSCAIRELLAINGCEVLNPDCYLPMKEFP